MALDLRSSELEHNFIKDRICNVEKQMMEVSSKLSSYIKKTAHLRDSGDDLAKCILHFASKENLNQTLRTALGEFSDILSTVQEYRDALIQRTEVKVVLELANYGPICKQARVDLNKCFEARARELSKKNYLEKTRGKNPTNWQKIAQAEKEVSQAQDEATRTTCELARQIDHFEKKKIDDIKQTFLEFIRIQMMFHAKAIELYTKAYNVIKSINTDEDLKEFRYHFKVQASTLDGDSSNTNAIIVSRADESCVSNSSYSFKLQSRGMQGPDKCVLAQEAATNASFDSSVESKFEFGNYSV